MLRGLTAFSGCSRGHGLRVVEAFWVWFGSWGLKLGRALGHVIISLIGLKRILFTNKLFKRFKSPS